MPRPGHYLLQAAGFHSFAKNKRYVATGERIQ